MENLLHRHLNWIKNDFDFHKILAIRNALREEDPFRNVGSKEISRELKLPIYNTKDILSTDLDAISYLIIDDKDFNGNLYFVKQCRNLRDLFICGICSEGKIKSIEPLKNLKKLRSINLKYHEITDLSWLSNLSELEEIYLSENPIKSIEPITHLSKIKKAEFSEVEEGEVYQLLKNNRDCIVSFTAIEEQLGYNAYWLKDWAFKTSYFKDYDKIYVEIAPLVIDRFYEKRDNDIRQYYVPILKQKTEDIAHSMLKDDEIIIGAGVYLKMAQEYLNAEFEFKLNPKVN